jgi:hypothetical protein
MGLMPVAVRYLLALVVVAFMGLSVGACGNADTLEAPAGVPGQPCSPVGEYGCNGAAWLTCGADLKWGIYRTCPSGQLCQLIYAELKCCPDGVTVC